MAGAKKASAALSPAVRKLAALPILIVVATKRGDGSVQLNPVWFELEDGFFWLNSNTKRTWPKNLQRDREVTMLLVDPRTPDHYAQIRGRLVSLIPDPKAEFINRLAHRYTGQKFRELEPDEHRVTLKIQPFAVTGQTI
ncbi:MAG: TIGR03618 family F420-dependent PPOX class oxidoreductase [Candidatus Dormibacteraeota bacterium]|nr:TIGR03618 family F420-dependent PPOX class oxidoreductase [Candidatus Dormibacteraeota bacterium]